MATIVDDRLEAGGRLSRPWLVVGTDVFMSGWGGAEGGASYAAWACETEADALFAEIDIRRRSDMRRVRIVLDTASKRYRPGSGCAHLHVYLWGNVEVPDDD